MGNYTHPISTVNQLPPVDSSTTIILDTETTGLHKMADYPFMILIGINDESYAIIDTDPCIQWLNDNLPTCKLLVMHNAKYDLNMLYNIGLDRGVINDTTIWCTYVTATLIDENRFEYGLDKLGEELFGIGKTDEVIYQWLADKFGGKPTRKAQIGRLIDAPSKMVAYYGVGDIEITRLLYEWQYDEVEKQDLWDIFKLEMEVTKALLWMELRGVPIDGALVDTTRDTMLTMQEAVDAHIIDMIGGPVNVRSPKQMTEAFEKLGIPIVYKPTTGNPTFAKDVLEQIDHPFIKSIFMGRSIGVMLNTFLDGFDRHVWDDGRIHANFNQVKGQTHGTRTGRLSSDTPNLQQIPKRNEELARHIRALFRAVKGKVWTSSDWSQFEFRIFGHYTKDPVLLDMFKVDPDLDFHQATADLTGLKRDPFAKQLNLGLVFGMGEGLMAKKCNLPYKEYHTHGKAMYEAGRQAKAIFKQYHRTLPGVKRMLRKAEAVAVKKGFVRTLLGRKLRFPNPARAYKAAGYIFQGTSADLMKKKLVELHHEFEGTDTELILPVHDEFNFLCPEGEEEFVEAKVNEILCDFPGLRIPITADTKSASNWWDASK